MKKIGLSFMFIFFWQVPVFANSEMDSSASQIRGYVETILIMPNILLPAKLDTGADTSSLSAQHLQFSKKAHLDGVAFDVTDKKTVYHLSYPILKMVAIKNRSGESIRSGSFVARPLIEMDVCLSGRIAKIKVNLVDRSQFQYPFLLGRQALAQYDVLVNPKVRNLNAKVPSLKNCHEN
jgi:hypothetical protein